MLVLSFSFLCYVLIQRVHMESSRREHAEQKGDTNNREHNIEFCIRQRDSQKIGAVCKVTIVEA